MHNREITYIAADWDNDVDAVNQLYKWNESAKHNFSFLNAHDLKQSKDTSLNCTIKKSLSDRLNPSKTFVLIVGENTKKLRAGSCQYCKSYNSYLNCCVKGYKVDMRSYIEYECDKAVKNNLNIIVLYKGTKVNRDQCPTAVSYIGNHSSMIKKINKQYYWDYQSVKKTFNI